MKLYLRTLPELLVISRISSAGRRLPARRWTGRKARFPPSAPARGRRCLQMKSRDRLIGRHTIYDASATSEPGYDVLYDAAYSIRLSLMF